MTEIIPNSFDELIQKELTKFDVVIPAVNELSNQFMPLKILSIDDKDGYTEVTKALRFIVSKRTAVEEKRKELKADSLAFGRAVDARAKEITAMLSPIEEHLKNEKNKIDAEIERIKREEEEKKAAKINSRTKQLFGLNMFQTMNEWVWKSRLTKEEEILPNINLELLSDEDFDFFVSSIQKKNAEEAEIINRQKEELERERQQIEAEKERLEKEKKEMQELRATVRNQALSQLGLGVVSYSPYWVFLSEGTVINIIHHLEVLTLTNDEWSQKFEEIKLIVSKLKSKTEIQKKINQLSNLSRWIKNWDELDFETMTTDVLETIKAEAIELKRLEDEAQAKKAAEAEEAMKQAAEALKRAEEAEKLLAEQRRKEEEQARKEEEERERLASLSDKERYIEYINKLIQVEAPSLKTKKWQGYITTINKTLETFKNMN